jgi:uncharacterized protein
LFVIAAGEVGLEQDFAERLVDASPSTVEVWIAPDAGHTGAFDRHPAEWEDRVTRFLDGALA